MIIVIIIFVKFRNKNFNAFFMYQYIPATANPVLSLAYLPVALVALKPAFAVSLVALKPALPVALATLPVLLLANLSPRRARLARFSPRRLSLYLAYIFFFCSALSSFFFSFFSSFSVFFKDFFTFLKFCLAPLSPRFKNPFLVLLYFFCASFISFV